MTSKKISIWTWSLLIIFVILVIVLAYGGALQGKGTITGIAGGKLNSMIGVNTLVCNNVAGGIRCDTDFYPVLQDNCSENMVAKCTNVCELDRLIVGDDRVCPSYCINYCLPQNIAEELDQNIATFNNTDFL